MKRSAKEIAWAMMDKNSPERKEAEKMMGLNFDDMTQEQRFLAATMLSAFDGLWNK